MEATRAKGGTTWSLRQAAQKTFKDHLGRTTRSSDYVYGNGEVGPFRRCALQIYTLCSVPNFAEFTSKFFEDLQARKSYYRTIDFCQRPCRFDFHKPLPSIEDCMKHHEAEKQYRRKNGLDKEFHIVPNWSTSSNVYKNFIIILDEETRDVASALTRGMYFVRWDYYPTNRNDSVYFMEQEDGVVNVEAPPLPEDPKTERLFDNAELASKLRIPEGDCQLSMSFSTRLEDMLYFLPDCCYRYTSCEGCREGGPHDNCEMLESECFVNEKAQCEGCVKAGYYCC